MKAHLLLALLALATTARAAQYDIDPYPAPISCKGEFRCAGDTYPKGKVSSNQAYWNEKECVADLKNQVAGQCTGGTVELINVVLLNKNQILSCSTQNYYFPYGAISGSGGGFGSIEGRTADEAKYNAYRTCSKHPRNNCLRTVVSPRNGCVGYYFSRAYWRDYFYTGCNATEVRKAARAGCAAAACDELDIRCAH